MKLLIILFLFSLPTSALALTQEDVVSSSLKHFPKVIESFQQLEMEKHKTKSLRGTFDGSIKGESDARTSGFYDGDIYKLSLEKPMPFLNSKVYGGVRQGFGEFPVYEGKSETLDRGEQFFGVSMSLLRNSLIDMNRYNIRYQEQNQKQSEININSVKLNVQTMALKAYWAWYVKGHELNVYKDILDIAEVRMKQIKRRIRAGDLARIYATENNQYILARKAQLTQINMEFKEASFYLSLFYRDKKGLPIEPTNQNVLQLHGKPLSTVSNYIKIYQKAVDSNLDLKKLSSKEKQANLDVDLGTNQLLPKLDLKYEWSEDRGMGSNTLAGDENRVMLTLEIPFQFRKGQGKRRLGKVKIQNIQLKRRWTREKIKVKVKSLMTKINSFADIYSMTTEQVSLAEKLAKAERRKFSQGASDLILVNLREEKLAEVQVKNLSSLLKYHILDADLRNIQVELMQ